MAARNPAENQDEGLCCNHLADKCQKEGCKYFHGDLPYQWQYKLQSEGMWKSFPSRSNIIAEELFSNPRNQDCEINMSKRERMTISFNNKSGLDEKKNVYDIQRLSTGSSVKYPRRKFTTEWQWYWESDDGSWKRYESRDSTNASREIEQTYQENPTGSKKFETSYEDYILDFQRMVQKNSRLKTERCMARRPLFLSKSDVEKKKEMLPKGLKGASSRSLVPSHWNVRPGVDISKHYSLVKVDNDQEEYKKVQSYFLDTLGRKVSVNNIERVENGELWKNYASKKENMSKTGAKQDVQERQLFHGTASKCIEPICRRGFDYQLSSERGGTPYGRGGHFATASRCPDRFAELEGSDKKMFVVKALVGDYTKGDRSYLQPPAKIPTDPSNPLYDSCVNNVANPTVFVIFDKDQVYPEYLITYKP